MPSFYEKIMVARSNLGGHKDYELHRTICEVFEFMNNKVKNPRRNSRILAKGSASRRPSKRNTLSLPVQQGCQYHFFLSHYKATGGDQVDALAMELDSRGNKAWYDNKMGSLTKADMETGVKESANFLLFLSEGVLMREYVQFAVQVALGAEKQVLLVTN